MARKVIHQLNHQIKLSESLNKLVFARLVRFEIRIESLHITISTVVDCSCGERRRDTWKRVKKGLPNLSRTWLISM